MPVTTAVIGGIDTHKHTHYAAAIDDHGRLLGHEEFPATDHGYRLLLTWMRSHGRVDAIGVESTGSFGATLTRSLTKAGELVVEVNRPNRVARRMDGKPDRLDAEQIARGPGENLDGDTEDQVWDRRGHPHSAGRPNQRGEGSHSSVQHPLGSHDRRSVAAAR